MASLVIDTGVDTHPQISIDTIDLARGQVIFKYIGGPYSGDCMEPFEISMADHGGATISEVASAITAEMISKLPSQE